MATKKYTVTLPEELAEEIRSEVGPGAFSAYVTQAIRRQRDNDRLGELVTWLEEEYGPVSEEALAAAHAEQCEIERWFAEKEATGAVRAEASVNAEAA
jgi:Arc/MetJ-type ribon-helix-helix transcriptional regulator